MEKQMALCTMRDSIVAHFAASFCDFYFYFWGEFADITFQGPQLLIYGANCAFHK